ncbi:hypothetical protein BD413DRAFT_543491 [Trametes elegans]|nr:hypothetical protein BD413DRAFT_543491 [Trametes elegans]
MCADAVGWVYHIMYACLVLSWTLRACVSSGSGLWKPGGRCLSGSSFLNHPSMADVQRCLPEGPQVVQPHSPDARRCRRIRCDKYGTSRE